MTVGTGLPANRSRRRRRTAAIYDLCYLIGALSLGCGVAYGADALSVWHVEQQRVADAMVEGNYDRALEVAETFEKELKKAKSSFTAKSHTLEHERATVFGHLMIGCAERMNGNYKASSVRFQYVISELTDIRRRNRRVKHLSDAAAEQLAAWSIYESLLAYTRGIETQAHLGGILPDAEAAGNAALQGKLHEMSAAFLNKKAQEAQANSSNAAKTIREVNSLLMGTYDATGSLALDEALPLTRRSLEKLRRGQVALGKAQQVREDITYGFDPEAIISPHGDETVTFLLNYGNVFLKLAELKFMYPDLPPSGESVDELLRRATNYFDEAEDRFSAVKPGLDDICRTINAFENMKKFKEAWVRDLLYPSPGGGQFNGGLTIGTTEVKSEADAKKVVDESCLGVQQFLLGRADLDFKQSELAIIKLLHELQAGQLQGPDRMERFDEAEQRLVEAGENLRFITNQVDHPFLVISHAKLASLEAIRAWMEMRKPDRAKYHKFLQDSQDLMQKRKLSAETVQGVYLHEAKECWKISEPLNPAEVVISQALMAETGENFVFEKASLVDLQAFIKANVGINFDFDLPALRELKIDLDEPSISEKKLGGVRLRYALRQILDAKNLTYVIKGGAVEVTSKKAASNWMP